MTSRKLATGFTIVELLIVIVVIAILAAISIVAYNGIQNRATSTAMASELKAAEKGLKLLAAEEGRSIWWTESELPGAGNPTVASLISNTNLSNYYQNVAPVVLRHSTNYIFDSDGDGDSTSCSTTNNNGVNLFLYNVSQQIVESVDSQIDDGDLSCGKVRYTSTGNLRYKLSADGAL